MPKVQQYGPQRVTTQQVRGPRAREPQFFGAGDLAQTLKPAANLAIDLKKQADTTAAEEALVAFERDKNDTLFNPESGYFNTQGRDAMDNASATQERLEELQRKYSEGLSSEQSRSMFKRASDAHLTRAGADIQRHSAKGLQAWELSTLKAQTENSLENASLYWNDPERLRVQAVLGEQSVLDAADRQGLSPEARNEQLQTFRSAFAKNSITAATQSSAAEGQEALDAAADRKLLEGPDKVQLEKSIAAKTKAEKTKSDAQMSVLTATRLNTQYDTLGEIMEEVDKIEDPELRKKTATEASTQFSRKKKIQKEQQASFYNAGIDHITEGGSAQTFQAQNPEAWEGMSAVQRNNLVNGKHMTTDQVRFNDLLSMPNSELRNVDPADYVGVFKPADVDKLRRAVDKANKGFTNSSVQSLSAKTNAIAEQFFGRKATWKNKSKAPKVQALMQAVQNTVEEAEDAKGSKLSPSEVDALLGDFTRNIAIERSALGFDLLAPDDELDIKNTPPEQVAAINRFVRQEGDASFQQVVNELNRRGVPVNADTIIAVYRQATQ